MHIKLIRSLKNETEDLLISVSLEINSWMYVTSIYLFIKDKNKPSKSYLIFQQQSELLNSKCQVLTVIYIILCVPSPRSEPFKLWVANSTK